MQFGKLKLWLSLGNVFLLRKTMSENTAFFLETDSWALYYANLGVGELATQENSLSVYPPGVLFPNASFEIMSSQEKSLRNLLEQNTKEKK